MKKEVVLLKTPQGEIEFKDLCELQYIKINNLMNIIEKEFNTSLHNHEKLRHEILNISNFVKRMPQMISEVVELENQKRMEE